MNIEIKNWKAIDSKGKTFDFFNYQADSWALLIFFRGKFCGLCRKQLMKINDNIEQFEKLNIKPIAISGDSKLSAAVLHAFLTMQFPNISDEERKIAKLFGAPTEEKDGKKYILPALFLINPQHEIVWAKKGQTFEDVLDFEELIKSLKEQLP